DVHRHVVETRIELFQGRRDRRRGNHHFNSAAKQMAYEEAAHLVPLFAGLVAEDVVQRIESCAAPKVVERAAHARSAELRIDRLAYRVEIVTYHDRLSRQGQRIEGVTDQR